MPAACGCGVAQCFNRHPPRSTTRTRLLLPPRPWLTTRRTDTLRTVRPCARWIAPSPHRHHCTFCAMLRLSTTLDNGLRVLAALPPFQHSCAPAPAPLSRPSRGPVPTTRSCTARRDTFIEIRYDGHCRTPSAIARTSPLRTVEAGHVAQCHTVSLARVCSMKARRITPHIPNASSPVGFGRIPISWRPLSPRLQEQAKAEAQTQEPATLICERSTANNSNARTPHRASHIMILRVVSPPVAELVGIPYETWRLKRVSAELTQLGSAKMSSAGDTGVNTEQRNAYALPKTCLQLLQCQQFGRV